ncbi:uncharacterized protein J3D65DRAFT_600718 [Phyllosticta citribraziliensis]|uniref:Uncharacterized protein n=1 Tax=Phyllosticta citribraziliensis TaxID=989973 RepID=A0ABR1LZF3_9PEZI
MSVRKRKTTTTKAGRAYTSKIPNLLKRHLTHMRGKYDALKKQTPFKRGRSKSIGNKGSSGKGFSRYNKVASRSRSSSWKTKASNAKPCFPSLPVLGGHVDYARPLLTRKKRTNWSLRVNHHQRSGSPFSHFSRSKKERATHLANLTWRKAGESCAALLKTKPSRRWSRVLEKLRQCSCIGDGETAEALEARVQEIQEKKVARRRMDEKIAKGPESGARLWGPRPPPESK